MSAEQPATAASDDRFCVCGAERGHYGSERCKPKPTLTDDTLPPFCEVHGCRGRWDDDRHNLCGKATTTAATRRDLRRQLLDAIEAWEDALTDEEREAQQEQAYALLDRLTGVRRG